MDAPDPDVDDLLSRPLGDLSPDDLVSLFVFLSDVARQEGLGALTRFAKPAREALLSQGLSLAAHGTLPELVQVILRALVHGRAVRAALRARVVIEGLTALMYGDNPRLIDQRLGNLTRAGEGPPTSLLDADGFAESLRTDPLSGRDVEGIRAALANLAESARRSGVAAMEGFLPFVDDALIAFGVRACLQGRDADWAEAVLAARVAGAARVVDLKSRIVLQGIRLLQGDTESDLMRARLSALAAPIDP